MDFFGVISSHSAELIFLLLSLGDCVLPSPTHWLVGDVLSDSCVSPSKYFLKQNDVLENCKVPKTSKSIDSRSVLCQGLVDVHMKFCAKFHSLPEAEVFNMTDSYYAGKGWRSKTLHDVCTRLENLSLSDETKFSELSLTPSFKKIAGHCKDMCESFGDPEDEPNFMCPILLTSAIVISKKNEAAGNLAKRKLCILQQFQLLQ